MGYNEDLVLCDITWVFRPVAVPLAQRRTLSANPTLVLDHGKIRVEN